MIDRKTDKLPSVKIMQEALLRETNSSIIKPFSFEVYKKNESEKAHLKEAKKLWNQAMYASHGPNYKKFNNPTL